MIKLFILICVILLGGCANSGAFSDKLSDMTVFTTATAVPHSEMRCVTLTQAFTLKSQFFVFTLPSGSYQGLRKNSTGYFYYAPSAVKSSSRLGSVSGIYINNQFTQGNLFTDNWGIYGSRSIRGTILPDSIFLYLRKDNKC